MNMNLGKPWEMVRNREAWRAADHGIAELDTAWRWSNNNGRKKSRFMVEGLSEI